MILRKKEEAGQGKGMGQTHFISVTEDICIFKQRYGFEDPSG